MRKRWFAAAGVALAGAVLVVLVWPVARQLGRGPGLHLDRYDLIQDGMTQAEVEAVLGASPGDYRTGDGVWVDTSSGPYPSGWRTESWKGDEGGVVVLFDEQGKVRERHFEPAWRMGADRLPVPVSPEPSLTDTVRARLRRLWP